MKKKDREVYYNETNNKCGYCGRDIDYKDMQIDHIVPQRHEGNSRYTTEELINSPQNLICSCRKCNHYKRAESLEGFREMIYTLHKRLEKIYIVEVGLNFGIVDIFTWNEKKFYFEKIGLKKFTDINQVITEKKK